jgi:hypothetical protein
LSKIRNIISCKRRTFGVPWNISWNIPPCKRALSHSSFLFSASSSSFLSLLSLPLIPEASVPRESSSNSIAAKVHSDSSGLTTPNRHLSVHVEETDSYLTQKKDFCVPPGTLKNAQSLSGIYKCVSASFDRNRSPAQQIPRGKGERERERESRACKHATNLNSSGQRETAAAGLQMI